MSGIQICCFSGRHKKKKIMNYEKLSVVKTGSNAGLYAKCYFHKQNLFSFYVLFINVSDNVDNYQRTRKSKTSALHGVNVIIVLCKHLLCVSFI